MSATLTDAEVRRAAQLLWEAWTRSAGHFVIGPAVSGWRSLDVRDQRERLVSGDE